MLAGAISVAGTVIFTVFLDSYRTIGESTGLSMVPPPEKPGRQD
jgi:hypothetical protein